MALGFGKFKFNNFRGACGSYFTIEIFKKDYSDNDNQGNPVIYPETTQARDFPNNNSFITYWNGPSTAGWSWSSDYGGSALHTAGDTDSLVYVFDYNLLVSGQQYEVIIELNGISNPQAANQIRVKLGTASTDAYTENGTYTSIVTANGGQLSLDPTTNFAGNVVSISLKKYFAPAEEFNTQGEGFEVTWNGQGETRNRQFLASECKIFYLVENTSTENFLYSIVNGGIKQYYVRIYRSQFPYGTAQGTSHTQIFWYGYIMPAFDAIENTSFPYVFTLTANDSYGLYGKKEVENFANEAEKTNRHSIKNIFRDFLIDNDLNDIEQLGQYTLNTNIDWWQASLGYGTYNPALKYHVSKGFVTKPTTYTDTGEIEYNNKPFEYKSIDVLNGVLKAMNLVGLQSDGGYWFIQPNSFIGNTLGQATIYRYTNAGFTQDPNSPFTFPFNEEVIMNSLTSLAEQSDTKILAGSTITYEPALRNVKINYQPGFANFSISSGQDLTTEFYAGSMQTGTGDYFLHFEAEFKEKFDNDDFVFNAPVGGIDWRLIDSAYITTGTLKIKITDGSTTKYLVSTEQNLEWVSASSNIILYRGYNATTSNAVNNEGELAIGQVQDNIPTNNNGHSSGPCQVYNAGGSNKRAVTQIKFEGIVNDPGISGDIFVEFDCSNNYFQAVRDNPSGPFPDYLWTYDDVNNPTIISSSCKAQNITFTALDTDNEETNVSNGIEYVASQNELEAFESEDLGDIRLGRNVNNLMYAIQYDSNPALGVQNWVSIDNLQRGNPTPATPFNPTQLLINEYLQMGVEPLEILQADIRSKFYSPRKIIKYSINNDGNFKYYMFMGGTYKASSEVMSGEWFLIGSTASNVIISQTPVISGPTVPPIENDLEGKTAKTQNTLSNLIKENALGLTSTDITHSTAYNKINFAVNTKGKVYDNQKLLLTYPDGSNPLVLTANGGNDITQSGIDVDSFTPRISYPIGSVLTSLIYDFTNVITAGTSTPNLYQGVTTTYIDISPQEFDITSHSNLSTYTRDNLGSVQPSSFINRSKAYASCFIPLNYKATAVDIYASANRNIRVLTARITQDTTTVQGSGTSNTTLTLSTAWPSVAGEYIILEFEFGASTDEIRGAKITIQAV